MRFAAELGSQVEFGVVLAKYREIVAAEAQEDPMSNLQLDLLNSQLCKLVDWVCEL